MAARPSGVWSTVWRGPKMGCHVGELMWYGDLSRSSIWSLLNPAMACRLSIPANTSSVARTETLRLRKTERSKLSSGYGQNRRSRSIAEKSWPRRILSPSSFRGYRFVDSTVSSDGDIDKAGEPWSVNEDARGWTRPWWHKDRCERSEAVGDDGRVDDGVKNGEKIEEGCMLAERKERNARWRNWSQVRQIQGLNKKKINTTTIRGWSQLKAS